MTRVSPSVSASAAAPKRWRLAALLTNPIQYLVPLMVKLARHPRIDLTVYYMCDIGLRPQRVKDFGDTYVWDMPLLDGYRSTFLPNWGRPPERSGPMGQVNPGIVPALALGRYDALYMTGYVTATELFAWATAQALRLPLLFHGDVVASSNVARSPLARLGFRRAFCAGIAAALLPSRSAGAFYDAYGVPRSRTFWVPLCVDNEAWMRRADALRPRQRDLKRELGLDPSLPCIVLVAQLRPVKRPLDLLEAFARMKTPASLVVVGNGPLLDAVERRARALSHLPVHLAGAKNQGELPRYYAAADVFVLCSEHEVNPLVVREAMCSSLPLVLSSGVTVAAEFVREGDNGFTFPAGDVAALADRLDRVLADPARLPAMGARSREIIAPWNYDTSVQGILEALDATHPIERSRA